MKNIDTKIKKLIIKEFKKNKKIYDDKEDVLIGIKDGDLYFFDGNLKVTNKIEIK